MLKIDKTSPSEASTDQNITKNWRDYLKELYLLTSNFYAETIVIIESSSQCTPLIDSLNRQIELTQQPRLYTITPIDIDKLIDGKVPAKNLGTVGKILKKVSVDAKKEIKSNNGVVPTELMAFLVKLQMFIIRDRYLSIKETHQELQRVLREEEEIIRRCREEEKSKKGKKGDKNECENIEKNLESVAIRKRMKALKLPEDFVEPLEGIDLYFVINKIYDVRLLHELGNIWVHVIGLIDFGSKDGGIEDEAVLKFWKASEITALPPQTCYVRYNPKIPSPDFPEESSIVYDDLVRICYNLLELTSLYQVYLLRLSILDVKSDKTVKLRGMKTYEEFLGKVPLEVQNVPLILSALIEEVVKRCEKTAQTTCDPTNKKKLPKNQVALSRSKIVQYGNVLDYQLSHLRYYEVAKKINLLALKATQPNLFTEQPEDHQEAVIAYKYLFHKWASGLDIPINRLKRYVESLVMVHGSFQKPPTIPTVLPKKTLKDLFFMPVKTFNRDFENIPEVFFRKELLPMVSIAEDPPFVPHCQHWEEYDQETLSQVLNVAYNDVKDFEYKYFAPHDTILLRFRSQPGTDHGRYPIRTVVPFRDFCAHIAGGEIDWLCEKSWRYWEEQESTVDTLLEAYNLSEQYYEISDKSFEYFSAEGIRVGLERRKFPGEVEICKVKVNVKDHLMMFQGKVRKRLDFRPLTFHFQLSNGIVMGFGPPRLPKEVVPCQDICIVSDTTREPRCRFATNTKSKTYRVCSSRLHKFSYLKPIKTSTISTRKAPSKLVPSRKVVIRKFLPVLPQNQTVHTLDYDFKTTLPSGLKIELLQGPKPVPFHVKQSYTRPRKNLIVKNEKYRCFLQGNVISFLTDGRVVVKSFDRVVQTLEYGYFSSNTNRGRGKWKHLIGQTGRSSIKLRLRSEKKLARVSKMIYRKTGKLPVMKVTIVDETGLLMVERVGKCPEEVRRYSETVFKGYSKGETFVQRDDGTSWFLDDQGRATTQFEDKTRITTWGTLIDENFYLCEYLEEEQFREYSWEESLKCTEEELRFTQVYDHSYYSDRTKVSCSIEDSVEPFVVYGLNYRYEHPNYMPVTDYCLDEVVTIEMQDGVEVEVKKRGGFAVTLQPNLTIEIDKEAVNLYEQSCETCNSYTEMKIDVSPFHPLSRRKPQGSFLELVDKQNTITQIDFLGNLTQSQCPAGESIYSQCTCPKKSLDRFFVLNRDLSGIELFSNPVPTRFVHTLTNFKPQKPESNENTTTIIQNLYKNYSEHFMMLYDLPLLGIATDQDNNDVLRCTFDYHKELLPLRTPIVVYERNMHHLYPQESLPEDLSNLLIVARQDHLEPATSLVKFIRDNSPDIPLPRLEPELQPKISRIVPVPTPENSPQTSILTTDMEIFEDKLEQGDIFEDTWMNTGIGESSVASEVTEVCADYCPGKKLEYASSQSICVPCVCCPRSGPASTCTQKVLEVENEKNIALKIIKAIIQTSKNQSPMNLSPVTIRPIISEQIKNQKLSKENAITIIQEVENLLFQDVYDHNQSLYHTAINVIKRVQQDISKTEDDQEKAQYNTQYLKDISIEASVMVYNSLENESSRMKAVEKVTSFLDQARLPRSKKEYVLNLVLRGFMKELHLINSQKEMFKFIANVAPENASKIIKYTEEVLMEKSSNMDNTKLSSKSSMESLRKRKESFSGQIKKKVSIDTGIKTVKQGASKTVLSGYSRERSKRSVLGARHS